MRTYRAVLLALAATTMAGMPTRAQEAKPHSAAHEWDYGKERGPSHWGDLKPEFATCRTGHQQSPIDIETTEKADLPPIQFDYHPTPLRIVDNGHTIVVTYAPGSSIRVGDHEYALKQFHFHHPSEEVTQGRHHEMSLHIVHADAQGRLAVVGVLLDPGRENPLLRELWSHLPREKEKEQLAAGIQVNVADLLPADHGYYTFEGSLTTPPCTEDVTWLVLKHPVSVSADEAQRFSKIYNNDARPTQPLHSRVVKETQ